MLDFQLVQAPFRFGVDGGTDPKQVPFGTLLTAQNVVWEKSGRLQKRLGTTTLTTSILSGGNISAAKRLLTRGSELALIDGSKIYSYTSNGWADRGQVSDVGLTWSTALDAVSGVGTADATLLSNGQSVEAWVSGDPQIGGTGGLYYQIRDTTTGAVVTSPTAPSASTVNPSIRLVSSGTTWVLLWLDGGGNLKCTTSTGTTTLKADAASGSAVSVLDAIVLGTDFVVGYTLAAGGIRLVRYSIATTPVQAATSTVTSEASTHIESISLAGGVSEKLYITYYRFTEKDIKFAIADPSTMVQTVAPTAIDTPVTIGNGCVAACRESSTSCILVYSFTSGTLGGANANGVTKTVSISSTGTVTNGQHHYFMRVLSRPFLMGSRFYCVLATDYAAPTFTGDNIVSNSDTFLAEVTRVTSSSPFREVGKIDALIGGCWTRGYVSSPVQYSSTQFVIPVGYQSTVSSGLGGAGVRQGVRSVSATSGTSVPADMWRSVELGNETYFAGGMISSYDGVEALGYGWPHGPYLDTGNTSVGASGAMADGTYIYNVTAERRSNAGILHRSPVGLGHSVTLANGSPIGSVIVGVVTAALGRSQNIPGQYALHRTLVNSSIPLRIAVEPGAMIIPDTNALGNPATTTDTYVDGLISSGLTLATRAALYTQGGELEDTQPPAASTVCLYRNRLFAILGDGKTLAFTKSATTNPGIAPGFHPSLRFVFNDTLTALAVLDERLCIFSQTGIYLISGNGPVPTGAESDYGEPTKLQTDIGCTNPRGVVSVAEGIFFVSGTSNSPGEPNSPQISMLDRKLNVQWVGKPIQPLLDAYPVVTSAVLVSDQNHVRFTCQAIDGLTGIVLVYDYIEQQWSHFIYGASLPIADACMHAGAYTFVTPAGVVYKESQSTYLDNGVWVTAILETAWTHAAGPLAYHSVRNFRIDGVAASAHGLAISVGFDGNLTYQQGPQSWAEGVSGVTTPADNITANISIGPRRKCRSIRFKIQDSAPATLGTGQGVKWSSMGIEVGIKGGLGRLPSTQKG